MEHKMKYTTKRDGMLVTRVPILEPIVYSGDKAIKVFNKKTLVVTYKDNVYQADDKSIIYINSRLQIAGVKYMQELFSGVKPAKAYEIVYKEEIVWRLADNTTTTIAVAELSDILELIMEKLTTL